MLVNLGITTGVRYLEVSVTLSVTFQEKNISVSEKRYVSNNDNKNQTPSLVHPAS